MFSFSLCSRKAAAPQLPILPGKPGSKPTEGSVALWLWCWVVSPGIRERSRCLWKRGGPDTTKGQGLMVLQVMSCAFIVTGTRGGRTSEEGAREGHRGWHSGLRASRAGHAVTSKPGGEAGASLCPAHFCRRRPATCPRASRCQHAHPLPRCFSGALELCCAPVGAGGRPWE